MRSTKREWLPLYSFYDRSGISRHLEEMATKGWMLESLGTYSWRYRRTDPKRLHFSVTYFPTASQFDPGPSADLTTFREFCAEAGWELVADSAQVQIFCNEQDRPVPIETDPAAEFANISRSMKRGPLASYVGLLVLCIFEILFGIWQILEDPIDTLSSSASLSASFGWFPLLFLVTIELIRFCRWLKKAKAAAEDSLPLPELRSAKGLSLLVLVVTGVQLLWMLFSAFQTSRRMLAVMLVVLAYFFLLFCLANWIKNSIKKLKFNRWINMAITIGVILLLTFTMMSGLMALIFRLNGNLLEDHPPVETYEYGNMTWDVYADPLPLTVQDLAETNGGGWSTRLVENSSPLLTHIEASQRSRLDAPKDTPDLEYEIVIVHVPALYNLCKNDFINWLERDNDQLPREYWDEYLPVDSAPWGASEAYQRYGSGEPINQFLICWPDRIAEIDFDWNWEITPEMISTAAKALRNT